MRIASSEFADDPCSSVKRGTMVRAARALLSAVTRLLILADMADVMRLLSHLKIVRVLIVRALFACSACRRAGTGSVRGGTVRVPCRLHWLLLRVVLHGWEVAPLCVSLTHFLMLKKLVFEDWK